MSVFISWSGNRSRKVAELLDEWLQCVLQTINPWISTQDISKGSLWNNEINSQLKESCTGIICLTKENKNAPWILFEAGSLAKGITSNHVCTFLIDLKSEDISDPLAQFNHTSPNKEDLFKLLRTLNQRLNIPLKEKILETVFEKYWSQFEDSFTIIIKETQDYSMEIPETTEKDILTEILSSVRNVEKRVRLLENREYSGIKKNINNKIDYYEKFYDERNNIDDERNNIDDERSTFYYINRNVSKRNVLERKNIFDKKIK